MTVPTAGGAPAPAADDLRSQLDAAWDADTADAPAPATPSVAPTAPAPAAAPAGVPRTVDGRFAPKEGEVAAPRSAQEGEQPVTGKAAATPPAAGQPPAAPGQEQPPAPAAGAKDAHLAGAAPPPGWSVAGKQAWNTLPEAVRGDIAKRETEINNGLAKLTEYKGLDPYVQFAADHGTTVPKALDNYIAAEQFLTKDPRAGILWLAESYGVDLRQLVPQTAQQQPPNPAAIGVQPPRPAVSSDEHLKPVNARISALENALRQSQQEQTSRLQAEEQREIAGVNATIQAFRADPKHPYFDNVRDVMGALIKGGKAKDMEDAYERACRADPEIYAALIKERDATAEQKRVSEAAAAASKARGASRSIAGAPAGTMPGATPSRSIRQELEDAFEPGRV